MTVIVEEILYTLLILQIQIQDDPGFQVKCLVMSTSMVSPLVYPGQSNRPLNTHMYIHRPPPTHTHSQSSVKTWICSVLLDNISNRNMKHGVLKGNGE